MRFLRAALTKYMDVMPMHLYRSGFSLIELMIVVAIIGILSAIAMPSYSGYLVRSKIPEATSALAVMRTQLEQYYQDHRDFGSSAAACGVAAPVLQNFTVSCTWGDGATAQRYLITATGSTARGTGGIAYTIDHQGKRNTIALPTGWSGEGKACWVLNKDGAC